MTKKLEKYVIIFIVLMLKMFFLRREVGWINEEEYVLAGLALINVENPKTQT